MKICFFDLDGTLLTDDKTLSYRTKIDLERLKHLGILVGYVTARTKRRITNLLSDLPCDFLATYDGAYIECFDKMNNSTNILNECIEDACAHNIIAQLSKLPNVDVFSYFEPFHIMNNKVSCSDSTCNYIYSKENMHCFSGCQRIRGRTNEEKKIFDNIIYPKGVFSYFENKDIVFRSDKVNKGFAVQHILQYYGLNRFDAVAFGDSEPDLEMFKKCEVSVAMGNSSQQIKKSATIISSSNNNDGVAEAIELIFGLR